MNLDTKTLPTACVANYRPLHFVVQQRFGVMQPPFTPLFLRSIEHPTSDDCDNFTELEGRIQANRSAARPSFRVRVRLAHRSPTLHLAFDSIMQRRFWDAV
jgi:hypothetical protein